MSFGIMILLNLALLILLILILSFLLRKLNIKKYQVAFALGHICYVIVILLIVLINIDDAQILLYWSFPTFLDMPFSILYIIAREFFYDWIGESYVLFPFLFFLIIGSFQYYLVGIVLNKILIKK